MSLDITITNSARDQLKKIIVEKKFDDQHLRLAVRGGGCSGFNYDLSFTDKTDKFDKTGESNSIKIAVDNKSYLYLKNMTLDYRSDLMWSGFIFINPNAKSTCGCGTSFGT